MEQLDIKRFTVTKELKKFTKEVALEEREFIIANKDKTGQFIGYCTRCCKESFGNSINHNFYGNCPVCGAKIKIKNSRYGRKNLDHKFIVYNFEEDKKNKGIIAKAWLVSREGYINYKEVETKYYLEAVYFFNESFCEMYFKGYNKIMEKRSSIFDVNNILKGIFRSYSYDTYIDLESFHKASKNNKFKYSELKAMKNRRKYMSEADFILKYLQLFIKREEIEKLNKIGCKDLVVEKVRGVSSLNWRGRSIYKILNLSKGDLRILTKNKIQITENLLNVYKLAKDNNSKIDAKEIEKLSLEVGYQVEILKEIINAIGKNKFDKFIKYIKNQLTIEDSYESLGIAIRMYKDYLNELKELKQDLSNERVIFPRILLEEHNRTSQQIVINKNKELQKKVAERRKELAKYKYANETYIIRAVRTLNEIIKEGKELGHCVAGYAKKHAEKTTSILVIRKRESPEIPFFTVEIYDDRIIQVRGKANRAMTEEVEAFIEGFKKEKLNNKEKEKLINIA